MKCKTSTIITLLAGIIVLTLIVIDSASAVIPIPLTIPEIQGNGRRSLFEGEVVSTEGVVTLISANGRDMWIQDPVGDGDPNTSDGILVDDRERLPGPAPDVGDLVSLTAEVVEQQFGNALPRTMLDNPDDYPFEILSSGNQLPAPVRLKNLPGESIPDGIDFWEPLEGMLVKIRNGRVVAPTNRFGEFSMLTKHDARHHSGYFPQTRQILLRSLGPNYVDYNPERILVTSTSLSEAIIVRPGDVVRKLVGVVDYTFGIYKLQPVNYKVKTHELPEPPAGNHFNMKNKTAITTFNVDNLFDLVDNPDKDDESATPTAEELEIQIAKLALAIEEKLQLPEIIVVQEVENTAILQELGDRVNDNTATDYMAVSFETSDGRGIEAGFLWDADRVTLLDAFQFDDTIAPGTSAAFGPASASPGREPLVGVFELKNKTITIIGNHFKSKGGDDPLFGVNWPPIRVTEDQRKEQARVVRNYVNSILNANPQDFVMVTGDLNDFQFGEPGEGPDHPIAILEGSFSEVPLINLVNFEKKAERYSFIFNGNSEVLDHMLVSPALFKYFVGADFLHFNASFPAELSAIETTPLRASDHDPLEGRFKFK